MSELRQRLLHSTVAGGFEGNGNMLSGLKKYDAYAKPLDDFRVRTVTGAAVTLLSAVVILFLTMSEFVDWYQVEMKPSLSVDKGRKERMNIYMNMTFPHMPCYLLGIDVMDVAGEHQNNLPHSMHKSRIDSMGRMLEKQKGTIGEPLHKEEKHRVSGSNETYCGDCYGAEKPKSGCCNSCDDVREAYDNSGWTFDSPDNIEQCIREGYSQRIAEQSREGCNIHGHIEVSKVQGNFHFAPGRSFQQGSAHVHDLHDFKPSNYSFSFEHFIHSIAFGSDLDFKQPLDNVHKTPPVKYFSYQYFVKVVGTHVAFMNGTKVASNQFSVTEHEKDVSPVFGDIPSGMPGVFFTYDISPMLVKYQEYRKPFTHFITDLCAITGGVFAVAGILDSLLYSAEKAFKAKAEIGKAS